MQPPEHFLQTCLFFNVNALSRQMLRLAENAFTPLKLSPAHATLLLLVYDRPGISPKNLSVQLQLAPSTITRFVDALVKKGLLMRKTHGKTASIFPTKKGLELKPAVAGAYKTFYINYAKALGRNTAQDLSLIMANANRQLAVFLETFSPSSR